MSRSVGALRSHPLRRRGRPSGGLDFFFHGDAGRVCCGCHRGAAQILGIAGGLRPGSAVCRGWRLVFVVLGPARGAGAVVDDVIFGLVLEGRGSWWILCEASGPVLVGAVPGLAARGVGPWGALVIGHLVLGASERAGALVCSGPGLDFVVDCSSGRGGGCACGCAVLESDGCGVGCFDLGVLVGFPVSVCCGGRACSAGCGGVR